MNGTFNSYSLALMVLHYLQQVKPPVLPNLQELFPEHFNSQRPLEQLQLYQETPEFSGRYANTQNVGELLVGFFDYFINRFDYQSWAISIRTASVIDRYSNLPEETDRFFLYIEEPFDLSNTARALRYPNEITIAFSETLKKLLEKPHMSTLGIY